MKKFLLIAICFIASFCGAVWYLFTSGIIVVSFPALAEYTFQTAAKKTITLKWFNDGQKNDEKVDIIWSDTIQHNLTTVVATWLSFMQEEELLDRRIKLESIALTASGSEAFISLTHPLVSPEKTIIKKWQSIESLFQTIKPLFPELAFVRFLVRGSDYCDEHIDFSISLPVTDFLKIYQTPLAPAPAKKIYTVVLAPYGDRNKTGRIIAREFERTFAREIALKIKKNLEDVPSIHVVITHEVGDVCGQEHHATLANRLNADLYIAINCFESKNIIPEIDYYFTLHYPGTDFWQKKREVVSLVPIDNAYLRNIHASLVYGLQFSKVIKEISNHKIVSNQCYGLPLVQTNGISVPSLVLECGIKGGEQTSLLSGVMADALSIIFSGRV